MDVIVLVGGQGTRLKSVVPDIPKPMASINGKPFLYYLLMRLCRFEVSRIILAVGYKYEAILDYFGTIFQGRELIYSREKQPLGTGGALRQALDYVLSDHVLLLNGDTLFDVDLREMYQYHIAHHADLTIALKPMTNFYRYGVVQERDGRILGFNEKCHCSAGLVNGGVYLINKATQGKLLLAEDRFSFERDFLEKKVNELSFSAFITDKYFIDIGIPEAYQTACCDFERMFS